MSRFAIFFVVCWTLIAISAAAAAYQNGQSSGRKQGLEEIANYATEGYATCHDICSDQRMIMYWVRGTVKDMK